MEVKNAQNIDQLKTILSEVKYNGKYDDLNDIVAWLRKKYNLYIWVERDTYWLGYRYVYEFDSPRGTTTGPCINGRDYYETMEDGIIDAAYKLLRYIRENYKDFKIKFDKI